MLSNYARKNLNNQNKKVAVNKEIFGNYFLYFSLHATNMKGFIDFNKFQKVI